MSVDPANTYPLAQPEQTAEAEHWGEVYGAIEGLGLSIDPAARADQVSQMTGEGMMRVATDLHTALAPNVSHEPIDRPMKMLSPDGVVRAELAAPSERAGIFEHAAGLVQELGARRQLGEDESYLRRAGNITALAVVLAHTFEDANGRTARTMAHVIRDGYNGTPDEQRDIQTVGSNRPSSGFKINSFLPKDEGLELTPKQLLNIAASIDIPLSEAERYKERKHHNFASPYYE